MDNEHKETCEKNHDENSCLLSPLTPEERQETAFEIRLKAAKFYDKLPLVNHPCNGDEERYPDKIASYSKALPHDKLGEVDLHAYRKYIKALKSGDPQDFEEIPLGGVKKLVNPQSAYAYELVGFDNYQLKIPPAPTFSSAQTAAELVELYWQALARDVPFNEYDTSPITVAAAKELSSLIDFHGPKINEQVTPQTLFRINLPGALVGPYISQFLWKDVPFVAKNIVQRYITTVPGDDHLTSYYDWLAVQNGSKPPSPNVFDPLPRYIRDLRGLTEFVHRDWSVEDGIIPCLILLSYGKAALDPNNPYLQSMTQVGFGTFGPPHALDFVSRAAREAINACWFQKWLVHRRLRPEEYGGRIQNKLTRDIDYPINNQILNSEALSLSFQKYGTYLLPQAYAEGCPTHPSYPSGHATFIGAMVTMLKAFFDESFVIPNPVVASNDGLSLTPYKGGALTVGGELNKLAYNIAVGRLAAGVHYRVSAEVGLYLGEQVAIGILRDYKKTYNEDFKGFKFTKFDGTPIVV